MTASEYDVIIIGGGHNGLTVLPANDMFCPLGSDDYLIFSGDVARTAQQFGRFSKHDGEIYPQFDAWLNQAAGIVRKLLLDTPGSAYVLLHHLMGEHEGAGGWGFIRGGMGAISEAIAESGRRHGMDIITDAEVTRIEVKNGRVANVVTSNGDAYRARAVAGNASCKVLFEQLLEPTHLPDDFLNHIRNYRTFSSAFKINVAADAAPSFTAFDATKVGYEVPNYIHIGPTVEYLQEAYDDACNGRYSARPFITAVVPTTVDDTLAPPGKHVINLFGGHAPYALKGTTWERERDGFTRNVFNTMDELAPGFSASVIDAQVLLPPDIEHMTNSPHGHIFHGELALEQLFFQRPAPHYADYRTPIRGLYQCGSSTHPGGGVSGIPGHNAAREILRD